MEEFEKFEKIEKFEKFEMNSRRKSLHVGMLVRQFSPHGGLELYAYKLVEGLLERGMELTVICQENLSELEHKPLKLNFKMIAAEPKNKSKSERLKFLFDSANEAISTLGDLDLIHSQHCPAAQADVVTFHNHSSKRLSEVGLWWERALNNQKRRVISAYKLKDRQDEILLRRAYCLIFPAEVMKDDYYRNFPFLQGPPSKPYVVAHPGASLQNAFENDGGIAAGQSRNDTFNFLFVGRGFRKKGLDILLNACRILKERNLNFRLLIAGLKEKPADRLRLNLLGLGACVKYLGFQKDMDAVYKEALVIILPSRVEPFGMAPVQGMQRGLVPIVSKVSGVAETVIDGQNGLILHNHLDAHELAELMQKLINDRDLLKSLSANAAKSAEKINWQQTLEQTLKAYEIALSLKTEAKSKLKS